MMEWKLLALFVAIGVCAAELDVSVNKLDDISEIKSRCDKKDPESYEKVKLAINETRTCLEGKINPSKIKDELEEAKKTGSMDEVFGKYCKKRPEYKECLMKTVNASKVCLEESEKTALDTGIKVIDEIVDFACFNDGDRLAMFVAEGGIECINSRTENLMNCINSTLNLDINPSQGFSMASLPNSLPSLTIDKKKCDDFAKIRQCVVNDLEQNCKDTTPANIVDALFKFVNKSTCKNHKQKRSKITLLGPIVKKFIRSIKWKTTNMIDFSAIHNKLVELCKENGGYEANNDFGDFLYAIKTCIERKQLFTTQKKEYLTNLHNCTVDWISKVERCLANEQKFYPSLFIRTLVSFIEFAYDHLNFHTLSPQSEMVNCFQRIKNADPKNNLYTCTHFILEPCTNFSILNKKELCKRWLQFQECFTSFIRKTCTRDIAVDTFLANFTSAAEKPCTNELFELS